MLQLGHPWVIADRYTARWPQAPCGSLIELTTQEGVSLGTALYDPGARIVARLLSTGLVELNQEWLTTRLEQAQAGRRWLDPGNTTVLRLANAEGDGLPGVTVDRYGEYLLVQYYSAVWESHLPLLVPALQKVYSPRGIYGKYRPQETRRLERERDSRPQLGRLLAGEPVPDELIVQENGLSFRVDLVRDLHTGLFHDQRKNRLEFRRLAAGCRVLNLFSYTGAFSVAAAAGGAIQVTSVDASARYLEWARGNFRLNDIDPAQHEFLTGDCFAILDQLARAGHSFDMVFLDPPSFSTTRQSRFTTAGGTAELVRKALALLVPNGLLITSSNHQKIVLADYLKELRKGSMEAGRRLQVVTVSGQAEDFPFSASFPEGHYLKYVVSVVQEKL